MLRCAMCGRQVIGNPNLNHHPWEPFNYAYLLTEKGLRVQFVLWRWRILGPLVRRGWL